MPGHLILSGTLDCFPSLVKSEEGGSHVRKSAQGESLIGVKQEDKMQCDPVKYMALGGGGGFMRKLGKSLCLPIPWVVMLCQNMFCFPSQIMVVTKF